MRSLILLPLLVGCGGSGHALIDGGLAIDGGSAIDGALPSDASVDAAIDAPAMPVDCTTYCTSMQANCIGSNAQYPGANATAAMQSCMVVCQSFPVGASKATDVSGNTLGCRIHFAMAASDAVGAADDCTAAGPLGDRIKTTATAFCSGGDVCASFCALEIVACGTLEAPLAGDPKDASNNSIYQYQNLNDCMDSCHLFNKANEYDLSSRGNSLACRLVQAVNAALVVDPNAIMDCGDTGAPPAGVCTGAASP